MGKVIAIANQKGGVGKTVTSVCLAACLAQNRNRVLVVDFDPQGSLTKGLGFRSPDSYQQSIKDLLFSEINEKDIDFNDSIIHTDEHFDLLPSNISLSGADIQLSSVMSRETVFKRVLDRIKDNYDYILIDSNPALNLFTINGLVAADSIIIPVQAEPYATDGLNDLLHTINTAKKQINPYLKIDGILITMTDGRTNLSKHIANEVRENYGKFIRVFKTEIPRAVKTSEASLSGQSPIKYAPNKDILYILKDGKYAILYLQNGDQKKVRKTLLQLYDEINDNYFYFADRGCIVNLANVIGLNVTSVLFPKNHQITISKSSILEFKQKMLEFWGNHI